jgi:hypothetical protein
MYRQQAEPHEPVACAARIACLVTCHIVHITRERSESHEHEYEYCGRALRERILMKSTVVWDVTPYSLADSTHHYHGYEDPTSNYREICFSEKEKILYKRRRCERHR